MDNPDVFMDQSLFGFLFSLLYGPLFFYTLDEKYEHFSYSISVTFSQFSSVHISCIRHIIVFFTKNFTLIGNVDCTRSPFTQVTLQHHLEPSTTKIPLFFFFFIIIIFCAYYFLQYFLASVFFFFALSL